MQTLFIIGNGFDLAHNLKTSYGHFKEYIMKKNPEIYNQINNQIFLGDEDLWSNFEINVGTSDEYFENGFELIIEEAQEAANGVSNSVDWLESNVLIQQDDNDLAIENEISDVLKEGYYSFKFDILYNKFIEYIKKLLCVADEVNYLEEKKEIVERLLDTNRSSKFITFNYTHTLEHTYSVKKSKILYIHGEINTEEKIVFGNDKGKITKLDPTAFNKPDTEYQKYVSQVEQWDALTDEERLNASPPEPKHDYPAHQAVKAIDFSSYVERYNTAKENWIKVLEIEKFEHFITQYTFNKIIVLGHSLGEVDWEYFKLINSYFPDATWELSVYEPAQGPSSTRTNFDSLFPDKNPNYFSL